MKIEKFNKLINIYLNQIFYHFKYLSFISTFN